LTPPQLLVAPTAGALIPLSRQLRHAPSLRGGEMIRQVDKSRFDIPMSGHPKLHRELMWYATDGDAVLGVVILDLVDKRADRKRPRAGLQG